jgi:hypothetical protein
VWPVAIGERGEGAIWGKPLKHFSAMEVDVGAGR